MPSQGQRTPASAQVRLPDTPVTSILGQGAEHWDLAAPGPPSAALEDGSKSFSLSFLFL